MKTVVVLQSNYIPWKGYFDLINDGHEFIFYDEAQYTKNDWLNRNKIYASKGLEWLTIPCGYDLKRRICEVKMNPEINWQKNHYEKLCAVYSKTPYFDKYRPFLEHVYLEKDWEFLSALNQFLIKHISYEILGIKTVFADSRDYESHGQKNEKLLSLLLSAGCRRYVSGPAAKVYLDEEAFCEQGIEVVWKDYSGYPEYKQQHEPFEHGVSILDLLFNIGSDAPYYIWGWRNG